MRHERVRRPVERRCASGGTPRRARAASGDTRARELWCLRCSTWTSPPFSPTTVREHRRQRALSGPRIPRPSASAKILASDSGLTTHSEIGYSQRTVQGVCIRGLARRAGRLTGRRPRVGGLEVYVESHVLPLFVRRTEEVAGLRRRLCVHGVAEESSGRTPGGSLGQGARPLPASIGRTTATCQGLRSGTEARC